MVRPGHYLSHATGLWYGSATEIPHEPNALNGLRVGVIIVSYLVVAAVAPTKVLAVAIECDGEKSAES